MQQKRKFKTKPNMLRATNVDKAIQFYTYVLGDVGDIEKVCSEGLLSKRMLCQLLSTKVCVQREVLGLGAGV